MSAKAEVKARYPKASALKLQYGSLIGWVIYKAERQAGTPGIGSGMTAAQAWQDAAYRLAKRGN